MCELQLRHPQLRLSLRMRVRRRLCVCLRLRVMRVIRCPPSILRPMPVLPESVALTACLQLITIHLVLLYEEQV